MNPFEYRIGQSNHVFLGLIEKTLRKIGIYNTLSVLKIVENILEVGNLSLNDRSNIKSIFENNQFRDVLKDVLQETLDNYIINISARSIDILEKTDFSKEQSVIECMEKLIINLDKIHDILFASHNPSKIAEISSEISQKILDKDINGFVSMKNKLIEIFNGLVNNQVSVYIMLGMQNKVDTGLESIKAPLQVFVEEMIDMNFLYSILLKDSNINMISRIDTKLKIDIDFAVRNLIDTIYSVLEIGDVSRYYNIVTNKISSELVVLFSQEIIDYLEKEFSLVHRNDNFTLVLRKKTYYIFNNKSNELVKVVKDGYFRMTYVNPTKLIGELDMIKNGVEYKSYIDLDTLNIYGGVMSRYLSTVFEAENIGDYVFLSTLESGNSRLIGLEKGLIHNFANRVDKMCRTVNVTNPYGNGNDDTIIVYYGYDINTDSLRRKIENEQYPKNDLGEYKDLYGYFVYSYQSGKDIAKFEHINIFHDNVFVGEYFDENGKLISYNLRDKCDVSEIYKIGDQKGLKI